MRHFLLGSVMLSMVFMGTGAAMAADTPVTKATPSATASSRPNHPKTTRHAAEKKPLFQRARKAQVSPKVTSQKGTPTTTTTTTSATSQQASH